ncbi:MAG TPA: ribose 5-phosphate isomerase A [Thermoleophilia bacterium]|nr:ribose 5-phosphate isomerase A [Thermoleophilia bacterium]
MTGAGADRAAVRPASPGETEAALARSAAARAAAARLVAGTTIGLGSGRAVVAVIEEAARRWPEGPPLLAAVASSATDHLARAAGFAVVSLDDLDLKRGALDRASPAALLDLVIDGADEVDPRLDLLKGGGGALLRERLLAAAAARLLIVVEDEKLVDRLGDRHALPVEIVRFGWRQTRRRILELLPAARLRQGGDGRAFVTDEGHFIVDCDLPAGGEDPSAGSDDLPALAAALKALPGVVDHGLFFGMADEVLVGHPDGSVEARVRSA